MKNQIHSINWFEIPVLDFNRAKTFYSTLYAYEMEVMEMGPYKMGILPSDPEQGGISGAIVLGKDYRPNADGIKVYLNGDPDLNDILGRVETAGGKIVQEKTQITPEIGYMAVFEDTEGNMINLHSHA
ncbi:MAG: lactoylglutathione lyase [Candidatus Arcticimaribacter sp.]|nr:VOC family protein [Flavobacteriaceae bacterium]PSR08769.1 MAG: lactoylglutathione lyase [Candidatus Arcticimaribacter sp.]